MFRDAERNTALTTIPRSSASEMVTFVLSDDIRARIIATWKSATAEQLISVHKSLREAPCADWDKHMQEIETAIDKIRDDLRRVRSTFVDDYVTKLQQRHKFRLLATQNELEHFVCEFNYARINLLNSYLDVTNGQAPVTQLLIRQEEIIPLIELWGTPASTLSEGWKKSILKQNRRLVVKTYDKYKRIAADLGTIMGRRPVEHIGISDLEGILSLWRGRVNSPRTVKGYFQILKTMLRLMPEHEHFERMFEKFRLSKDKTDAARLSFTDEQIRILSDGIIDGDDVREDDRALVCMMLLTGARLEEIYQLTPSDLSPCQKGWMIRIADSRQTGHGESHTKNSASARRIPIIKGVFPDMDDWIERHQSFAFIFPNGSKNKHGIRSAAASKRLNRLIRKYFPDDKRLVLQSTRNTVARIMRRENVDIRVRYRFLGHKDAGIHMTHYDHSSQMDAEDLMAASKAIARHLLTLR